MSNDTENHKKDDSVATDTEQQQKKYPFPWYVAFILGNEFCERYSYYGMRTILVLYLTYFIGFDEDDSTVIYHAFTVLAYLFPLLGGALSDGFWGKYKTILYLSCVYAIGMILNVVSSIPALSPEDSQFRTTNAVLALIGLVTIALGTGGIKPCVSSFGGDQFEIDDKQGVTLFYDIFYWCVNAGSLVSTFVSPIVRTMSCGVLGTEDSCYFIAFLIPAILMMISIAFFIFGTRYYNYVQPAGQNIFWESLKCIWYGATCKIPDDAPEGADHWLYGAYGKVDTWLIRDVKYMVRILIMYTPIPAYRAAFDQQGSRWTLQAVRMNGFVSENVQILPDQIQIINPILILTFIPLFNLMYRGIDKVCGANTVTKLRKIGFGMFMAGVAYVVAAQVQAQIDLTLTKSPEIDSEMSIRVLNLAGRNVTGNFVGLGSQTIPSELDVENGYIIPPSHYSMLLEDADKSTDEFILATSNSDEENGYAFAVDGASHPYAFDIDSGRLVWTMAIFSGERHFTYPSWSSKDASGRNHITIVNSLSKELSVSLTCQSSSCSGSDSDYQNMNIGVCNFDSEGHIVKNYSNDSDIDVNPFGCVNGEVRNYDYPILVAKGTWSIVVADAVTGEELTTYIDIGSGASYTFTVWADDNGITKIGVLQDINANDVSLLLIIPQFFTITVAEVMVSVTGLEFSYSQAPPSLKSVLQSFWLLTTSIGNIIVIIVAEGKFLPTQVGEYYLFAGICAGAGVVFVILATFYFEYVKEGEFEAFEYPEYMTGVKLQDSESSSNHTTSLKGESNAGFESK